MTLAGMNGISTSAVAAAPGTPGRENGHVGLATMPPPACRSTFSSRILTVTGSRPRSEASSAVLGTDEDGRSPADRGREGPGRRRDRRQSRQLLRSLDLSADKPFAAACFLAYASFRAMMRDSAASRSRKSADRAISPDPGGGAPLPPGTRYTRAAVDVPVAPRARLDGTGATMQVRQEAYRQPRSGREVA